MPNSSADESWETLLDAAEHLLVPVDLEVGMEASLHEDAGAAKFDGFANLFVDGVEVEDVTFFRSRSFQGTIKGAEGAIFRAEIRVIDVAVDDVRDRAFGMKAAADGVGFHANADEVVGLEHLEGLLFGQGHSLPHGKQHSIAILLIV